MHERFKNEFKEFGLSLSQVEDKIGVKKNYLSQFINGPRDLPVKWEAPIDAFINEIRQHLKKLDPPPPNPDLLRPWIKIIENYCAGAGIQPEDLVEGYKKLLQLQNIKIQSVVTYEVHTPPKSEEKHINSAPQMSDWATERRKKKLGF